MNKFIKDTLIFVLGAGIGGGATYFFVKDKYEKVCEAEINKMRETYTSMQKELVEKNESEKKIVLANAATEASGYFTETPVKEISKETVIEHLETSEEEPIATIIKQNSYSKNDPEFISEDDYNIGYEEGDSVYDSETLYFNDDDGEIYIDDPENPSKKILFENPEMYLGSLNMNKMPELFEENNALYIRNYQHNCDYEILLDINAAD